MQIQEQAIEEREAAEAFRIEEAENGIGHFVPAKMTRMFEHFGRTGEVKSASELDEGDLADFQARSAGYIPNGEVVTLGGSKWRIESRLVPNRADSSIQLPPYKKGEPNILTVERQRRGEVVPR